MKVDYFTFSLPYEGQVWHILPQHEAFQFKRRNECKPNGRYGRAWRLDCGAMFSIPKDGDWGQKALIEMQGKHCERAREMGLCDDELIRLALGANGATSRIDCAFDTNNEKADVADVWQAWEKGKIKTKIQTATRTTKKGRKGEPENTVYLGATESEQKIVVYDKAKQMKLLHQAWVRVELRLYGDSARRATQDATRESITTVAQQKVRNMLQTKIKWFNDMVSGKDIDLTPREDNPDLMKWLNKQVAPAIDDIPLENDELLRSVTHWLHARLNVMEGKRIEKQVSEWFTS